jgi:hypothetical protein
VANKELVRASGITHLYHFTDAANLISVQKSGLMSASNLLKNSIPAKLNSDELSRNLDAKAGLENFVRLSFCSNHPMMHVAKKEGRITEPVILKIDLDALLRPGVLFSDVNATKRGASLADRPNHIHFDVVRAQSVFALPTAVREFYQAEVLIPSPLPPELITFPKKQRKSGRHSFPSPILSFSALSVFVPSSFLYA